MSKTRLEALRTRWTPELSSAAIRWLSGKGEPPFPDLADGRRDLRGLTLNQVVKDATLRDVDLSGAVTKGFGQLNMCFVFNSSFRDARLDTNLRKHFQGCDFTRANLSTVTMWGAFVDCDFTSASLSSASANEGRFIRCRFHKTNLRKAHLLHCTFEDCEFVECRFGSGSLSFSKFIRSPIVSTDLGDTMMEKVVVDG